MSKVSKVTTVTAYIDGGSEMVDQPGFYDRLRELLDEFDATDVIITIEESEVDW